MPSNNHVFLTTNKYEPIINKNPPLWWWLNVLKKHTFLPRVRVIATDVTKVAVRGWELLHQWAAKWRNQCETRCDWTTGWQLVTCYIHHGYRLSSPTLWGHRGYIADGGTSCVAQVCSCLIISGTHFVRLNAKGALHAEVCFGEFFVDRSRAFSFSVWRQEIVTDDISFAILGPCCCAKNHCGER